MSFTVSDDGVTSDRAELFSCGVEVCSVLSFPRDVSPLASEEEAKVPELSLCKETATVPLKLELSLPEEASTGFSELELSCAKETATIGIKPEQSCAKDASTVFGLFEILEVGPELPSAKGAATVDLRLAFDLSELELACAKAAATAGGLVFWPAPGFFFDEFSIFLSSSLAGENKSEPADSGKLRPWRG